mmetsp:Transcript_735/g.1721  ORF Transcript_735/g.1721 Transcript_735/m.1721 type:complete len:215 (-) Transcript_735:433-1077(-)
MIHLVHARWGSVTPTLKVIFDSPPFTVQLVILTVVADPSLEPNVHNVHGPIVRENATFAHGLAPCNNALMKHIRADRNTRRSLATVCVSTRGPDGIVLTFQPVIKGVHRTNGVLPCAARKVICKKGLAEPEKSLLRFRCRGVEGLIKDQLGKRFWIVQIASIGWCHTPNDNGLASTLLYKDVVKQFLSPLEIPFELILVPVQQTHIGGRGELQP